MMYAIALFYKKERRRARWIVTNISDFLSKAIRIGLGYVDKDDHEFFRLKHNENQYRVRSYGVTSGV